MFFVAIALFEQKGDACVTVNKHDAERIYESGAVGFDVDGFLESRNEIDPPKMRNIKHKKVVISIFEGTVLGIGILASIIAAIITKNNGICSWEYTIQVLDISEELQDIIVNLFTIGAFVLFLCIYFLVYILIKYLLYGPRSKDTQS